MLSRATFVDSLSPQGLANVRGSQGFRLGTPISQLAPCSCRRICNGRLLLLFRREALMLQLNSHLQWNL
jgi:hypothetical protein